MRILGIVICAALAFGNAGQARGAEPVAPLDYKPSQYWICRPDKPDGCRDDLTTQVLHTDGSTSIQHFIPAKAPKADCFYVYPTVSNGPGITAPAQISEDERRAVRQQAERLGAICRLYAPIYRQITLTSMKSAMAGVPLGGMDEAQRIASADVEAAWRTYLSHYNKGRGVILVGHSQGAGVLRNLMAREIDGKPVQRRLIAAVLPGNAVMAPRGRDVGGTFQAISACRNASQIGCVIVFNSYRADRLVPPERVFKTKDGQEPICTNPAALGGGPGELKPILSTQGETIIPELTERQGPWTLAPRPIDAPFVSLPALLQAECRNDEHGVYLAVTAHPGPGDRRTGAFVGDWVFEGRTNVTMGLHLIDLNLTMGNLLDVLGRQIEVYEQTYR